MTVQSGRTDRSRRLARLFAAVRRRGSGRERADDRLAALWCPLDTPATDRTLGALLAPGAGLTPFEGRASELAELLRWCTDPAATSVRVLTGPCGVGKSRLAVELVRALPPGWTGGMARPGAAAQTVAAAVDERSVLVVVDDADAEPDADIAALLDQAASAPVRVLLVMREQHPPVDAVESTMLRVVGADDDRRRFFAAAVRGFADLGGDTALPPWAEPEGGPVGGGEEPMLITQARAALAVLGDDSDHARAMRTADLDALTDAILAHERRRWACSPLERPAREESVLALLLTGPRGIDDAVDTLRSLPRFRDASDDHLREIATWVEELYPGQPGGPWPDPRPDLVGAALLTLATDPRHAQVVDRMDLPAAAARDPEVVVRLARAADHQPRVAALLGTLFTGARLATMAEATMLAGARGVGLRNHLVAALTRRSLTSAEAGRLLTAAEAPMWSAVRLPIRRAEVAHLRETVAGGPRLAAALTGLSTCLRDLGAHEDALAAAREAVRLFRSSADPHTADLAAALTHLGTCLREGGEPAAALAATREAVRLYRGLDPDRHAPDLAHALAALAADLCESGSPEDALAGAREAVGWYRRLAEDAPACHNADLATALVGLGACLRENGTCDEARTVTDEAVRLYRDVAANGTQRHDAELTRALTDLATDLREAGEGDEVLTVVREAVQRGRELVAADPDRHTPDLARALTVLGAALREGGSHTAGLAAAREAVQLYRGLAAADPARHTAGLANSLTHLGIAQRGLGQGTEGLAAAGEAVQLYRGVAAADPVRHTPGLANSLTQLAVSLRGRGAHHEALGAVCEAVELTRELAVTNPARHIDDLVRSLISLGASLRARGRRPEAVQCEADAVAWWWHLTQQRPGEFDDRYRDAQRRFFRTFSTYDHAPDDLLTAELIARSRVLAYVDAVTPSRQSSSDEEALAG